MDMQDREFDDVFRNKLDGFEAEPSAKVWMGIDATLDEKSRKKAIMPWLSIAASIIVLLSAGILFIPKKTSTQHHGEGIVKTPPVHAIAQPKQETPIKEPALQTQIAVVPATAKPVIRHTKKIEKTVAPAEKPTEQIAKTEIAKPVEQPILAAVSQKQQQVSDRSGTLLRVINLLALSLTVVFLVVAAGQLLLIYVCWQIATNQR